MSIEKTIILYSNNNYEFAYKIKKICKDKFYIELIDTASTQDELNLKEQYWIRQYNSVNSDYGYNETDALTKCGGNTYQSKTTQEMSIIEGKIRQSKIGDKNPKARQGISSSLKA